jgi:hypothetical protein
MVHVCPFGLVKYKVKTFGTNHHVTWCLRMCAIEQESLSVESSLPKFTVSLIWGSYLTIFVLAFLYKRRHKKNTI